MRIVSYAPMGFSKFNILASAALAVMLAACSSSVERFAENPSNSDPVYTASVPKPKRVAYQDQNDEGIVSKPLANAAVNPPKYSYNTNRYKKPTYKQPVYQDEAQVADEPTYAEPTYKKPAYAKTAAKAPAMQKSGTVRVEQGMTLYSIAKANRLSVAQLASANGISAPYSVSTGRVLRIPGSTHAIAPKMANAIASSEDNSAAEMPAKKVIAGGSHKVASGETLFSLGRKYGVSPYTIADLNGLPHDKALILGQNIRVPSQGGPVIASRQPKNLNEETVASNDMQPEIVDAPKNLAANQSLAVEEIPAANPVVKPASQPVAELNANPTTGGTMRWPVKGKIISEYGAKPNGLKNEGINIAVPEGTGVRAAESGVVAYAGNELKGYGNLVLIRHEGGWVTAYAHASELFVKRGDTVKRGDVIAKAGQTGSVSSPQLHFEVRKGATAMDPMKFLANATASN
jgi:murein DD-endopeptidase MepM/ murein hydrolase activator NlpD